MTKQKKAIFLDIDGTILDCFGGIREITPAVTKAIRHLQAEGHCVFIATGRPYSFLNDHLLNFGFDGYIVANGAQVILHNQTIAIHPIEQEFIRDLTKKLEDLRISYILEGPHYSYLKKEFSDFYQFYDDAGISKELIEKDYVLDDIQTLKVEMLSPDKSKLQPCITLIEEHPDYDYFHSINGKVVELYAKKSTKATAIHSALKYLNLSIDNSYAFGDGKNDIEMLSAVGCGIAMGNAPDEVKAHANKVTDSIHMDGVATGIYQYIL